MHILYSVEEDVSVAFKNVIIFINTISENFHDQLDRYNNRFVK